MSVLEEKVRVSARLPVEPQDTKSIHLIDGMAVVQMMKSGNASTFGELANKFYAITTEPLLQNGCDRVDIVFDQYRDMSIKSHERSRRGSSSALEVKINSPSTPVPRQWAKYISNPRNKTNLCTFLAQVLSELGRKKLPQGKCLVIGGAAVMERVHFISEETIRLLLSEIFKLTTKKLTRGYCFTPNMLPNQIAALSFILLTLMY